MESTRQSNPNLKQFADECESFDVPPHLERRAYNALAKPRGLFLQSL
jgi:hypothetical protein